MNLVLIIKRGLLLPLLAALVVVTTANGEEEVAATTLHPRLGRCPGTVLKAAGPGDGCSAPGANDSALTCRTDADCTGSFLCCSDGCSGRHCTLPVLTACEHLKATGRVAGGGSSSSWVPRCLHDGRFDPVQCDDGRHCWCVDEAGFELGGTRARSRGDVNCTSPRPCAGHMCRMLCPFEFELDDDGCPLCQCRDPCRGVRCPGGTKCHLEVVECVRDQPCPPLPTCKQGRSMDDVCPVGEALTMTERESPFLCGRGPTRPQCPAFFECVIEPGRDYGVCCPSPDKLVKPGSCPAPRANSTSCGRSCNHDMECEGLHKCCECGGGGSSCVPMAEDTACLQQKMLAELLSAGERVGRGYVPQCTAEGLFRPKQCSRNGKVCWCVRVDGVKVPRTMGPSETVWCNSSAGAEDSLAAATPTTSPPQRDCDPVLCTSVCSYGFDVDADGCPTCDCADLCESIRCLSGTVCVTVEDDACEREPCETFPVCKPPPILYSKLGTCPSSSSLATCDDDRNATCFRDGDCPGSSKCCPVSKACGEERKAKRVCLEPAGQRLPTMCEYLRDFGSNAVDATPLALAPPTCSRDGAFERFQCDPVQCWCVDEFGGEVPATRTEASRRATMDCDTATRRRSCDGLLCRLGCDYGFERDDDDCPVCECRNPCKGVACDDGFECQMVEVNCYGGFCPSVPRCVPLQRPSGQCPALPGTVPLQHPLTNVTRACGPSSPCPATHFCQGDDDAGAAGMCCQKPVRPGQCPYRFVPKFAHCENGSTCAGDHQCPGKEKCCSDGCRSSCVAPEFKTACQHAAAAATFMTQERSLVLGKSRAPQCRDDGTFSAVQCHGQACWCVDAGGKEVPGTRSRTRDALVDCTGNFSSACAAVPGPSCVDLNCTDGYRLDERGCPTCACHDPCEDFLCAKANEECRPVQLDCASEEPCPPVAMCVLRRDNPCPSGRPIPDRRCSTLPRGLTCPSTHICLDSPMGNFDAVCCPKSRDVCMQDPGVVRCPDSSLSRRWSFHLTDNVCVEAPPGGYCPTSINSFASEADCRAVCPTLSECERSREKALRFSKRTGAFGFFPKCKKDGAWEPVQCLPELGLCWCVGAAGDYVKGSAVRGSTPSCGGSARMGRRKWDDPPPTSIDDDPGLSECERRARRVIDAGGWTPRVVGSSFEAVDGTTTPMVLMPPRCDSDGRFESVQRQGELSWCVDGHGMALQDTLTRGHVRCDANGTVVSRTSLAAPVCANDSATPRVCEDECLVAQCPSRPDALCLADPCRNCSTSFVGPADGEAVECGGRRCSLPKRVGMCRASMKRWWFDEASGRCERFIFGGCDGNDNNFETQEQCEATCPDVVPCPSRDKTVPPSSCRRSVLCANLTCADDPEATCTVDPCDCRTLFVDLDGKPVECVPQKEEAQDSSTVPTSSGGTVDEWDTALVVGCVVVVTLLLSILLVTLVVVHRRRRSHGYYPRGSMDSLSTVGSRVAALRLPTPPSASSDWNEPPTTTTEHHHYEVLERIYY